MAQAGSLHDAFIDELRDTYDAEKQLVKALTKLAKASTSDDLRAAFESPHQSTVDLTPLKTPEESLSLVMDMIALANRDGTFHPAEKVFVRHVAGQVGFPAADLDALLG